MCFIIISVRRIEFYTGLLLVAMLFASVTLASSKVSADGDTVVDEINVTVPISCTMSGNGMNSHNAEIGNGVLYGELDMDAETGAAIYDGVGTTIVQAFCNDNAGFSIYAAGYTGDEVGGTDSTKLMGTSASNNSYIATGIDLGNTQDVSNWAMVVYKISDSGDTSSGNAFTIDNSFQWGHVVPDAYTKVAHKNAATSMEAVNGGAEFGTTYYVYVSKTQPADTYSGKVIYTLIHPAYADAQGCNPSANTIGEALCMQDISATNKATILSSMTEEQQYTLKDKRDGKMYTVVKAPFTKDDMYFLAWNYVYSCQTGNCNSSIYNQLTSELQEYVDSCNGSISNWNYNTAIALTPNTYGIFMTQNLDLDIDSNTTYTNEDTDIGYNASTGLYDIASWTPIRSTYTSGTTSWNDYDSTTNPTGVNGSISPESYDPGDLFWDSEASGANQIKSTGVPQRHLGNYYNWTAALATNDSSDYPIIETDEETGDTRIIPPRQSICPVGWTVFNGEDGSYYSLVNVNGFGSGAIQGGKKIWDNPLYLSPVGYYDGELKNVGTEGYYLSFSVWGVSNIEGLYFNTQGGIDGDYTIGRTVGYPVRCAVR